MKTIKPVKGKFKHAYGLPMPEGMKCSARYGESELVVESKGNLFSISASKISSVSLKTDIDIQNQYVSSAGGAIAGAALFGVAGALIGGRTKKKSTTTIKRFLVITYNSEQGPTYLMLQPSIGTPAKSFVKVFKKVTASQKKGERKKKEKVEL